MPLTIESAQTIFSSTQVPSPIPAAIALFDQLSVDDQLALLWYAYTEMGRTITPAAPGAARLQFAENLLKQIQQMSNDEQMQVMRDLATNADTPISRSYGAFSVNTKLGFWYQLAELMTQGLVAPIPTGYQMSSGVEAVLEAIKKLDPGQQITILRNTVIDMGFDSALVSNKYPKTDSTIAPPKPSSTVQVTIEGVTEPTVLRYFEAMNAGDLQAVTALFAPEGALQPPFEKPMVGYDAIAAYMREEAPGLKLLPGQGISRTQEDGSKQFKITGKCQTPWFGVNVGMNLAWRFLINPQGKIFFLAIDMLASPQELLNLRPS